MMTVMLCIEKIQEKTLVMLVQVESAVRESSTSIKSLVDAVDTLGKYLSSVGEKMEITDSRVVALEKENAEFCVKVEEFDA